MYNEPIECHFAVRRLVLIKFKNIENGRLDHHIEV